LFIIISEKSRNIIKELMINQSLKLIFCYEQLIYLKIKMITKSLKLLKILKKKIYIKNINNIINLKIKNKKKNYVENRKKISNIKKIYYIYFFLISKIYNR
jgi:transaldolase